LRLASLSFGEGTRVRSNDEVETAKNNDENLNLKLKMNSE